MAATATELQRNTKFLASCQDDSKGRQSGYMASTAAVAEAHRRWCHASWALSEQFSCPLVHRYVSSAATKVCQYCSSTVAVVAALEALGCWLPGSEFSGQHYPELAAFLPGSPLQAELSHYTQPRSRGTT
ncbi:unnamed protein product [Sphagnum balticum]